MVGSLGCARIARIGQKQRRLSEDGKVVTLPHFYQSSYLHLKQGLSIAGLLVGRKEEAGEWTGLGLRTLLGSLANKYALFFYKSRPLSMTYVNNFKNHIC